MSKSREKKTRSRRRYSASDKADFIRRHLKDKESVSEICSTSSLQPSVLYSWESTVFENLPELLESKKRGRKPIDETAALKAEIELLKAKLQRKEHVIAEITEELVDVKKSIGER